MQLTEIEAWALRVIDAASRGKVEDANVELKAEWPEPKGAARRIAALANAAGGSPTLVLVGVAEHQGIVPLPVEVDPAGWWTQVVKEFDEDIAPALTDLVVHRGANKAHALCFDTRRAPFVVKNPSGLLPHREVPFREGTSVRTARRSDLIQILVPKQPVPAASVRSAYLFANLARVEGAATDSPLGPDVTWLLRVELYLVAPGRTFVTLPARDVSATLYAVEERVTWQAMLARPYARRPTGPRSGTEGSFETIHEGVEQLVVEGSGFAWVTANGRIPALNGATPPVNQVDEIAATVSFVEPASNASITATATLRQATPPGRPNPDQHLGYWEQTL